MLIHLESIRSIPKGLGRSAENHYSTMSLEDIQNLPINNLADKISI